MEAKIKAAIKDFYTEGGMDIDLDIAERIPSYLDDDWELDGDGYNSEEEWYQDYGRGEAEGEIHNELLDAIEKAIDETIGSWYYNDKYGDVDEYIYEEYPQLNTN